MQLLERKGAHVLQEHMFGGCCSLQPETYCSALCGSSKAHLFFLLQRASAVPTEQGRERLKGQLLS